MHTTYSGPISTLSIIIQLVSLALAPILLPPPTQHFDNTTFSPRLAAAPPPTPTVDVDEEAEGSGRRVSLSARYLPAFTQPIRGAKGAVEEAL